MLHEIAKMMKEKGQLHRLLIGTDSPIGAGWRAHEMIRMVSNIAAFNGISGEDAIACATGNTADCLRLNNGKIEVGREADLIIIDAPNDSQGKDALGAIEIGDGAGQCLVMVDGEIVTLWGVETLIPRQQVSINGTEYVYKNFHEWARGGYPPRPDSVP